MKNNTSTSKGKIFLKRIGFAAFAIAIGGGGPGTIGLLQAVCVKDTAHLAFKQINKWIDEDISELHLVDMPEKFGIKYNIKINDDDIGYRSSKEGEL